MHLKLIAPQFFYMSKQEKTIETKAFKIKANSKINLKDFATEYKGNELNKENSVYLLEKGKEELSILQDKLYAHNKYGILIIFQAMDAAGKDGAVKHVMSGLNPQGVKVHSFKAPTSHELDHNYLWRHQLAMPARGEFSIHNRSHYENVLIAKVHNHIVLNEQLPTINSVADIDKKFWENRYAQINRFEQNLAENGTIILKFFLNVSKKEQKKRFLERIDDPSKNWKFSMGDIQERQYWENYQAAYEDAINATSTEYAPWYIIPADDKWYARLLIASIIKETVDKLDLAYPSLAESEKAKLQDAKNALLAEEDNEGKKDKKKKK